MLFRLKRLTTEVFELEIGEEYVSSVSLLTVKDISLLKEVLNAGTSLPVAKSVERCYNG